VDIDERKTATATVRMIKEGDQNDWFSITIHEGRNRQVRRMCEAVSLSVVRLRRVRYGMLTLDALKPGEFRTLTDAEVRGLGAPTQNRPSVTSPARQNNSERKPKQPGSGSTFPAKRGTGHRTAPPKKNGAPRKP
jgi:23S rRNA pseudouridine2605 synthase